MVDRVSERGPPGTPGPCGDCERVVGVSIK